MRFSALLMAVLLAAPASALAENRIVLDVHDATLADVFSLLATQSGVNIILDDSVKDERVSVHLRGVTLHDALEVLTQTHGLVERHVGRIIVVGAAETLNQRYSSPKQKAVHVYRLRYARPADVAAALKSSFPDGAFSGDEAQNAVIASVDGNTWKEIAVFLESLDSPSQQVLFEVRVADVRPVDEQSDIGFQFGGYDLSGQPISGAATYAFARNSLAVNARLNALISSGHARILATPKLLTLNNHEADMLIGETYPVVYYDARLGGQQVQFVDIGVKLRLTPIIGSDGSVTAEMHPEYSAIEGFVGGYPVIANRRVDSTLRVRDNQTIVLGGLLRDIDSETITKVPGLSAIPIFGRLFEDRARSHQRDEVIFLITPHIIPSR